MTKEYTEEEIIEVFTKIRDAINLFLIPILADLGRLLGVDIAKNEINDMQINCDRIVDFSSRVLVSIKDTEIMWITCRIFHNGRLCDYI